MSLANILNSADPLEQIIVFWARSAASDIRAAYGMKGQWEAWCQVNIARYVQTQFPDTSVLREQQIWNQSQDYADIVLSSTNQPGFIQVIELKVDLIREGSPSLASRWESDINKIGNTPKPNYQPAYFVAAAICCTAESDKLMVAKAKALEAQKNGKTWCFELSNPPIQGLKLYIWSRK